MIYLPLDITDVESCSAVQAGSSSHQFFKENVISEGDIEHTMDGELLNVFIELSLCSWESIEDDSFCWFRFFDFLVNDIDNDRVTDESTWFDDTSDGFYEIFVESAADGSFEYFSDLISGGNVVVVEIFSEQFGVGAFAYSWCSEEEEEFLFAWGEVGDGLVCESKHDMFNKSYSYTQNNHDSEVFLTRGK